MLEDKSGYLWVSTYNGLFRYNPVNGKFIRFGKEDNFWEHGSGPCGPCSEIYYDRGEKYGCGEPGCTVGCECDRYMEIWNNVFSQFNNDGHGNYTDLIQKNIDTGMGLERLACIVQDVDSMFDIDTMKALRDHVCRLSGKQYGTDHETDVSLRVVTDHVRSVTFMISDGILPSNSGRGYVLRRLLRRACRHGRLLGIKGAFLVKLAQTVIDGSKDGYPELEEKKTFILNVLHNEESQFNKTIDQNSRIKTFRCQTLRIHRSKPGVVHFDGDPMMMGENVDVKIMKKGLQVIVPRDAEKDTSNVLQRAQDYINGLKQINDAFVEDIAHKNKMILDKGKRQFKKLTKM